MFRQAYCWVNRPWGPFSRSAAEEARARNRGLPTDRVRPPDCLISPIQAVTIPRMPGRPQGPHVCWRKPGRVASGQRVLNTGVLIGGGHESWTSEISASRHRDGRASDALALRLGAGLSDAAGAHHRAGRSRRCARHPGAADRAMAFGAAWPVVRHREPAGRGNQYRRRGRRTRGSGRLHAAPDPAIGDDQRDAVRRISRSISSAISFRSR